MADLFGTLQPCAATMNLKFDQIVAIHLSEKLAGNSLGSALPLRGSHQLQSAALRCQGKAPVTLHITPTQLMST